MTEPTFDANGYPSRRTLLAIEQWPSDEIDNLFRFLRSAWKWREFCRRYRRYYSFSTGGWSGNEDLIRALQQNTVAWGLCWVSSERGGHYRFELPEE